MTLEEDKILLYRDRISNWHLVLISKVSRGASIKECDQILKSIHNSYIKLNQWHQRLKQKHRQMYLQSVN